VLAADGSVNECMGNGKGKIQPEIMSVMVGKAARNREREEKKGRLTGEDPGCI
jgi:hypothetical protein